MLDTFKVRLKAKSTASGANLSQARIDALADRLHKKFPDVTEETDHDLKIDDLYQPDDLKEFAALDDYQRAKAAKANKDIKKPDGKQATQDPPSDEPPAWAKALQEKIDRLESEKQQSQISQKLFSHEKLKGVPKTFMDGRALPDKEEDIDTYAENLSKQWIGIKQSISDENFQAGNKPAFSTQQTAGSDKVSSEMKSFLDKKKAETTKT